MKFLKVPRQLAEKTRQELAEANLISIDYEIFTEGDFVFIPVQGEWKDFELIEKEAEKREMEHKSLVGALFDLLGEEELEHLTTSFDIIGDIAIVEIPDSLEGKEKEIGEALLRVHKNVRSVFKKLGPMEGEFRVRKLELIAGEDNTETLYKEHGCSIKLDVSKVYFSVRLSHERRRIADLVEKNEKIIVMFAGVGPFALVIAKKQPETEIVAIELNPAATAYMKENVEINRADNIIVEQGDVREVMEKYHDYADRIVMPLPKTAHEFLDVAFAGIKNDGIIHFYTLADSEDPFEDAMEKAEEIASKNNVKLELVSKRIVRPYSKDIVQVVLDLKINKPL